MRHQKGFTLIELIVVLGLAGMIMSVVMSFFIMNIKNYETINTESEVQYESQNIINYITNIILEAESFEPKVGEQYIFKYSDGKVASLEGDNNKQIKYIFDSQPPIYIGNYVEDLNLSIDPIDTNRIKITLVLKKGKYEYTAEQHVYMRNS